MLGIDKINQLFEEAGLPFRFYYGDLLDFGKIIEAVAIVVEKRVLEKLEKSKNGPVS